MSLLEGLSVDLLRARLTALQLVLLDLQSGKQVATASYTQGDGSQTVSYRAANIGDLTAAILALQQQIDALSGVSTKRRAPLTPYWRR